jgi:hypothetical protein
VSPRSRKLMRVIKRQAARGRRSMGRGARPRLLSFTLQAGVPLLEAARRFCGADSPAAC